MASYTKKAVYGVSIIFLMGILASLLAYLLRLLLARSLSVNDYGLVYGIIALFGIFSIFQTLGLNSALAKYIAEFRTRNEFNNIKSSILITFLIQFISTLILGAIFIVFSDIIANDYFHETSASLLIKIYAMGIVFSPMQNIVKGIFQGFQRMGYYSSVDFLKMLSILIITYILLEAGFSVSAPIIAYTLAYVIPFLFHFQIISKVIFPDFRKIKSGFDSKLADKLVTFGIPVIFTEAASTIFGYTDTIMITFFRSLEDVGLYNVGMPTAGVIWKITIALSIILLPLSSELWIIEKKEKIKKGLLDLYKYSTILILPVSLIMFLFPEIIIKILFGSEYIGASNVLRILSIGSIVFAISSANNSLLIGIGQPKEVSKIMLIGSLFNIIGNLILIPLYGIEGAALTTLIAFVIMMYLGIFRLKEFIGIELPWKDLLKIALAGIIFSIVVFSINENLSVNLWVKLFVSVIVGLLVYMGSIFFLNVLTLEEVRTLVRRVI